MILERQHPEPDELLAIRQIAQGIRFAIVLGVLASGCYCAWFFWSTPPKFRTIFQDMLGPDHALPAATHYITQFWPGFVALTSILSLSAIITARKAQNMFTVIATGAVVFTIQIGLVLVASRYISVPLQQIIYGLSN